MRSSWNSRRVNQYAHHGGLLLELVEVVALDELRARRNRIFDHQVLPVRPGHRQPHRDHVAARRRPVNGSSRMTILSPSFEGTSLK